MRLVVDVRFDVTGIVGLAVVREWKLNALLWSVGDQFIPFEIAAAVRALVLRAKQRPFLQNQHGLSRFRQNMCDRRTARTAADYDGVELIFHLYSLPRSNARQQT